MSTHASGEKKHPGFGERIKGAAHVVHGIGEDIRGSVLGAIESGQGSEEAKAKEEGIATKGRSEIERGVAQMKGVAVPASTTAGPESHVEGKTSGQQQQPAKQEASESPAPASAGPTQATGSAGAESHVEGKIGEQPQQQPAKQETSGPPPPTPVSPQAAVRTDESRQAEPVSSRQEPTGQAGKSSQGTQAASEAKTPPMGDKGLIREGGTPQGSGGSV